MAAPSFVAEPPVAPPATEAAPVTAAPPAASGVWSVRARLFLAAGVLCAGALLQTGLLLYVRAGGTPPAAELAAPLKSLPLTLGHWRGEDLEITDRNALYGNEHLKRRYVLEGSRQEVLIWMVYSRIGVDRDHHPEVCYAVKGKTENGNNRRTLDVDALAAQTPGAGSAARGNAKSGAPVQVFNFGDERESQSVYYWNYTLPTPNLDGLDVVRRTYHRMRTRPASVTAEVFAGQVRGTRTAEVDAFVAELDRALQTIVGPEATRSSERKPFTILDSHAESTEE